MVCKLVTLLPAIRLLFFLCPLYLGDGDTDGREILHDGRPTYRPRTGLGGGSPMDPQIRNFGPKFIWPQIYLKR